jgi:membrane-bound lytic murein transglycosylase D
MQYQEPKTWSCITMNTTTTNLLWLSGMAMAVSAVSGIAALSSGHGMHIDQAEWIQSRCADSGMPDFCAADLQADFATSGADAPREDATEDPAPAAEIWGRLRSGFTLPSSNDPEVRHALDRYQKHPEAVARLLQRGEPYLFHILNRVEERGLPAELALLPCVESAFDPQATSPVGAAGLWQFMPDTAESLGLSQDWWYDGRLDVIDATEAALDYLAGLHRTFGDWLLALAAYNAGSARIQRAIAQNRSEGKPVDFWHLPLPAETRSYVPRLIALRTVIRRPARFNVTLPSLPDTHYFTRVNTQGRIDLQVAAQLAGVSEEELERLNPGILRLTTPPDRPSLLLIPKSSESLFGERLARLPEEERIRSIRHRILRGDTLGTIARHYRTTVERLLEVNHLDNTEIIAGEFIVVPGS